MFNIEKLVDGEWLLASSHTELEDAQAQWDRFVSAEAPETFRKQGW